MPSLAPRALAATAAAQHAVAAPTSKYRRPGTGDRPYSRVRSRLAAPGARSIEAAAAAPTAPPPPPPPPPPTPAPPPPPTRATRSALRNRPRLDLEVSCLRLIIS